ncbi:MAG: hypothetical protein SGJ27_02230 [Candidatus Melainabacteria bacterium]|nr:hypothetical protein [Candidatus Melainabacteria bacterium]
MEMIAQAVNIFHAASNMFILLIIVCTIGMSYFLYKILFNSDFFSNYDRNL